VKEPFEIIKNMPEEQIMREALEINGGGVNTNIPMTLRQYPGISKKARRRDNQIVKVIVYLFDVMDRKDEAVEVFFENKHRLSDPCFWEMLRTLWIANGKMKNLPMFRQLFQSRRPFRKFLMTIEEEAVFNSLPEQVTAYRAQASVDDQGISWTLNREVAERLARVYGREIIERQLSKSEITAYFNRRNESEIIVL